MLKNNDNTSIPATPAPREDRPEWMDKDWMANHRELVQSTAEQADATLVFAGDSITRGWLDEGKAEWDTHFAPLNALNLGICGDQTQHLLWRLENNEHLPRLDPQSVVLLIGTNNLGCDKTLQEPADVARGVQASGRTLRRLLPNARVLTLAILPRGQYPDDVARRRVEQTNDILKKLDLGQGVTLADIGKNFLESDGAIAPEIMPDFLHLTPRGYRIFAQAILPLISANHYRAQSQHN